MYPLPSRMEEGTCIDGQPSGLNVDINECEWTKDKDTYGQLEASCSHMKRSTLRSDWATSSKADGLCSSLWHDRHEAKLSPNPEK